MPAIHEKPQPIPELQHASAGALMQEALKDAGELARIEGSIALAELRRDATAVFVATGVIAASLALAVIALAVLIAAALLALGMSVTLTLCATGGVSLLLAVVGGAVAYREVPRDAFAETRESVGRDIQEVKERSS